MKAMKTTNATVESIPPKNLFKSESPFFLFICRCMKVLSHIVNPKKGKNKNKKEKKSKITLDPLKYWDKKGDKTGDNLKAV
jgi:hypothetical protein